MLIKMVKLGLIGLAGIAVVGGMLLGKDAVSYLTSSARSVQASVKSNVPIEFELRRARDLLNDIIPEMHANVRLVAQQEVEIEELKQQIGYGWENLREQRQFVRDLRERLDTRQTSFTFGNLAYTREQVTDDLNRRFAMMKEAEVVLAAKERLLENRQRSLAAAVQTIERTKSQKALLESQIASLEGQHKLVEAASIGSSVQIDNSKLAQTEKLIGHIKKQLDVAERVLAHEAKFIEPMMITSTNEQELLVQVDEHLASAKQ
jgi:hypothetical protein